MFFVLMVFLVGLCCFFGLLLEDKCSGSRVYDLG